MKEAVRVIDSNGAIYVIHWRYDPTTPRGPCMEIRPRPEQIRGWALEAGLSAPSGEAIELPPYHSGLEFRKDPSE